MDPHFWHERWMRGEIGFHQAEVNLYLQNFWHRTRTVAAGRVLVPLCGKSRDLLWLAGQGFQVVGLELSPIAVAAFFDEQGITPTRNQVGAFEMWSCADITILCGDVFALDTSQLGPIHAVYDRAALIALPEVLRRRYAHHLSTFLPAGCPVLLVTVEYPQAQMSGPPFCVLEAEVRALYGASCDLELIQREDILASQSRFRERGLTQLHEAVYLLRRRAA